MNVERPHAIASAEQGRWPAAIAASMFLLALSALGLFHPELFGFAGRMMRSAGPVVLLIGLVPLAVALGGWLRSAPAAGSEKSVGRIAMIAFIATESMFFAAFFAFYLRFAVDPAAASLISWPPANMRPEDPWGGPLLNTAILLASGAAVAVAHDAYLGGRRKIALAGLALAVLLGVGFLGLQVREFLLAQFGFGDGVYASIFFLATGFHGLHVAIGATLLAICLARIAGGPPQGQNGLFEASAWYWHFVDVVWLLLFAVFYAWGG